ncbi:hypothetical protein G5B47_06555 [Paenibacillus sp. 7124]|uniref:Uncharacterized protein n=1 Tax=Paenibacillus apii TaxID=1850370 RepID=A0A6M1PI55_9BACL|nr:hypothetical protein [Paenibacillus apii]NGM82068.1 hypothetical protein [Paenibacillus apii]NJJ39201.1 hypothetical protein [Paenibacillus apii]
MICPKEFTEAGAAAFGIGSELVNKSVVDSGSYDQLTKRAEDFIEAVRRVRHGKAIDAI